MTSQTKGDLQMALQDQNHKSYCCSGMFYSLKTVQDWLVPSRIPPHTFLKSPNKQTLNFREIFSIIEKNILREKPKLSVTASAQLLSYKDHCSSYFCIKITVVKILTSFPTQIFRFKWSTVAQIWRYFIFSSPLFPIT